MDNAVALVQAYLRVNGYFTVCEYPVLEATRAGGYRALTDLDILAFRFSGAGQHPAGWREHTRGTSELVLPDPALGIPPGQSDMLVGEVKEGRAVLNAAATNPEVLRAALVRFGCETPAEAEATVTQLLRAGRATLSNGHSLRLVAFGATADEDASHTFHVVRLGHVLDFLRRYLLEHWELVRHAEWKDPALGFLLLMEKAARGVA
jgi:hypothetical protein